MLLSPASDHFQTMEHRFSPRLAPSTTQGSQRHHQGDVKKLVYRAYLRAKRKSPHLVTTRAPFSFVNEKSYPTILLRVRSFLSERNRFRNWMPFRQALGRLRNCKRSILLFSPFIRWHVYVLHFPIDANKNHFTESWNLKVFHEITFVYKMKLKKLERKISYSNTLLVDRH